MQDKLNPKQCKIKIIGGKINHNENTHYPYTPIYYTIIKNKGSIKGIGQICNRQLVTIVDAPESSTSFHGNGDAELFVQKVIKITNPTLRQIFTSKSSWIIKTLTNYNTLLQAGLPVVKTYTDGKYIYTKYIHGPNILTISPNSIESANIAKKFNKNWYATNLEKFTKKLIQSNLKASKHNIKIPFDAYFYIINKHNKKKADIDFIIGDLDFVYANNADMANESGYINNFIENLSHAFYILGIFLYRSNNAIKLIYNNETLDILLSDLNNNRTVFSLYKYLCEAHDCYHALYITTMVFYNLIHLERKDSILNQKL